MKDEDGDGIYTLYWTTYNGDEYKAVYYNGTSFENWYPNTADNYKIGSAEKTGYCLVQCSPDGKLTNSNKVFSINKA